MFKEMVLTFLVEGFCVFNKIQFTVSVSTKVNLAGILILLMSTTMSYDN